MRAQTPFTIRRAAVCERAALGAVAFAAKAYWNYDDAFMESIRDYLIPPAPYVERDPVFAAVADDGTILGFYGFTKRAGGVDFLEDLYVGPTHIGTGVGRALWAHAVATARSLGYREFFIESDPNAEPFYRSRGAVRVGDYVSEATGRALPLMRYEIAFMPEPPRSDVM